MSDYYDRKGEPITLDEWMVAFQDDEQKRVDKTEIGDVTISTVWLGLDHSWGNGPPLIFETMIFGGDHSEDQWRYATEDAAREGHAQAVALVESS